MGRRGRWVKGLAFLWLLSLLLISAIAVTPVVEVKAAPDIIYPTIDGEVASDGTAITDGFHIFTGDNPENYYSQIFLKFSLAGISGTLSSATLNIRLSFSYKDGASDGTDPLTNPGLGDCLVRHIDDFGTLDAGDLDAPSIGYDPGVLISSTATPNRGYVSIDVTAAMQDDINNGRAHTSYMIKMEINTDNDGRMDGWGFLASEHDGEYRGDDPYIKYSIGAPPPPRRPPYVGGEVYAPSMLMVLSPYLALIGLAAIATIILKKRKR